MSAQNQRSKSATNIIRKNQLAITCTNQQYRIYQTYIIQLYHPKNEKKTSIIIAQKQNELEHLLLYENRQKQLNSKYISTIVLYQQRRQHALNHQVEKWRKLKSAKQVENQIRNEVGFRSQTYIQQREDFYQQKMNNKEQKLNQLQKEKEEAFRERCRIQKALSDEKRMFQNQFQSQFMKRSAMF